MQYKLPLALFVVIPLLASATLVSGCLPAARKIADGTSSTPVPSGPEGLAESLLANPAMQAIKETDPAAYEGLRKELVDTLKLDSDLSKVTPTMQTFITKFLMKNLPHKSAATLKKYMAHRVAMLKKMYGVAPEYAYANIRGEPIQPKNEEELKRFVEAMGADKSNKDNLTVAELIKAPIAPPVPQDNMQAARDFEVVLKTLSPDEKKLLVQQSKGGDRLVATVEIRQYCQAIFHYMDEILKLPDERAVQLFRLLEDLPKDDRLKGK